MIGGFDFCRNMIHRKEWNLVKFFVHLLILWKTEMIKFKQEFRERVQTRIALHQRNKKGKNECLLVQIFSNLR